MARAGASRKTAKETRQLGAWTRDCKKRSAFRRGQAAPEGAEPVAWRSKARGRQLGYLVAAICRNGMQLAVARWPRARGGRRGADHRTLRVGTWGTGQPRLRPARLGGPWGDGHLSCFAAFEAAARFEAWHFGTATGPEGRRRRGFPAARTSRSILGMTVAPGALARGSRRTDRPPWRELGRGERHPPRLNAGRRGGPRSRRWQRTKAENRTLGRWAVRRPRRMVA